MDTTGFRYDYLRIPHPFKLLDSEVFQAAGEGEAELGALNKRNLIDGVITADGDTFVFGAEKVFRM